MKTGRQNLTHAGFSHPDGVSGLLSEMDIKSRMQAEYRSDDRKLWKYKFSDAVARRLLYKNRDL
jgi:hypothetical protein